MSVKTQLFMFYFLTRFYWWLQSSSAESPGLCVLPVGSHYPLYCDASGEQSCPLPLPPGYWHPNKNVCTRSSPLGSNLISIPVGCSDVVVHSSTSTRIQNVIFELHSSLMDYHSVVHCRDLHIKDTQLSYTTCPGTNMTDPLHKLTECLRR